MAPVQPSEENDSGDVEPISIGNELSPCSNDTDSDHARGTNSSLPPPTVSTRNHSSRSRSRSRHRHHHSSRHGRCRFKRKESNLAAAVCSMVVVVLLCTSLAEPQWFSLSGGGCKQGDVPVHSLGLSEFFYFGRFLHSTGSKYSAINSVYRYGPGHDQILLDCVSPQMIAIMKSLISLCFFAIVFTLAAFIMDLLGPTHRMLKVIRRNGICNILTVAICVVMNGFCYWGTEVILLLQRKTKPHSGSKPQVQFGVSFFLIVASGGLSVVATACNLLRRRKPTPDPYPEQREHLLDNFDDLDLQPPSGDPPYPSITTEAPPPYAP